MDNTTENLPEVLTNAVHAIQDRQLNTPNPNAPNHINQPTLVHDDQKWRNILAFWILGMCNNYGYAVMLSAAFDILKSFSGGPVR